MTAPAEVIAELVNDVCQVKPMGQWQLPVTVADVLEVQALSLLDRAAAALPHRPMKLPRALRSAAELEYSRTGSLVAVMQMGLSYPSAKDVIDRMSA